MSQLKRNAIKTHHTIQTDLLMRPKDISLRLEFLCDKQFFFFFARMLTCQMLTRTKRKHKNEKKKKCFFFSILVTLQPHWQMFFAQKMWAYDWHYPLTETISIRILYLPLDLFEPINWIFSSISFTSDWDFVSIFDDIWISFDNTIEHNF